MRTPAGKECQFYYADYFRGREKVTCRLLVSANPPLIWQSSHCDTCPVPDILMANTCPNMVLKPSLVRRFPFTKQHVRVVAYCLKTSHLVEEPYIGCGECHPLPFDLPGETNDSDPSG
jgi:hypothetical protein